MTKSLPLALLAGAALLSGSAAMATAKPHKAPAAKTVKVTKTSTKTTKK